MRGKRKMAVRSVATAFTACKIERGRASLPRLGLPSAISQVLLLLLILLLAFTKGPANAAPLAIPKDPLPYPTESAQKSSGSKTATRAKAKPGSKMYLWKMSSDTGATLYLMGTIHVFKQEYYPLPTEMEQALNKSRALIVEIDTTTPDSKERLQQALMKRGFYRPPDNLSKHISKETLDHFEKYCSKSGLSAPKMMMMKPGTVTLVAEQLELQKLGYSTETGLDKHFIAEATIKGKKIIGLETEDFQMSLFSDLPENLQELMLKVLFEDLPTLKEDVQKMMQYWLDGNEEAMVEIMAKDVKQHPEYAPIEEKILYERNVSMAQKLEAYLKEPADDVYIVAIGSGHLLGPRSVIEHLKAKGYKCKPILVGDPI